MANWLSQITSALTGRAEKLARVRELLQSHLEKEPIPVEVEPQLDFDTPVVMTARLLEVREEDMFISVPLVDGSARRLRSGQNVRLLFIIPGRALQCQTRVTDRDRIKVDGEEDLVPGLRLALPETLETKTEDDELGRVHRIAHDMIVEAELMCSSMANPVRGLLRTVGITAATLVSRNAEGRLDVGQHVHFRVDLPEPVGSIYEPTQVTDLEEQDDGSILVSVRYREPVKAIGQLFHPIRRAG